MERREYDALGFELTMKDADGKDCRFCIESSGHAEGILRAMVHSGIKVGIEEKPMRVRRPVEVHDRPRNRQETSEDEVGCAPRPMRENAVMTSGLAGYART